MKKGSLQKVMAIILSVTMITGMLMVDTALAMDGFILGDNSENRLVDDTEATECTSELHFGSKRS